MKDSALALSLAGLAFMMTIIWGGPLLAILRYFKIGKQIRVEEPGKHFSKMGTPTMGGVMIILPVILLTVMLNAVSLFGMKLLGKSVLVPMAAMIGYAMLGAIDDWQGIHGKRKGRGDAHPHQTHRPGRPGIGPGHGPEIYPGCARSLPAGHPFQGVRI